MMAGASMCVAATGGAFVFAGPAAAQQSMAGSEKIWNALKGDVLGDRPILLDTGLIRIEAPKRAQDAALVPVDIYIDPAKAAGVNKGRKPSVPVDQNKALRAEGVSPSEISRRLDVGRTSVYRALGMVA